VNVLVIAPHPDDEAIGCGGAVLLHSQRGDRVAVAFLTSGELGLKSLPPAEAICVRESEAAAAAQVLGIEAYFLRLPDWGCEDQIVQGAAQLASQLSRYRPAVVYVPHPADNHPDHRAALPMLQAALNGNAAPEVRGYEVWSPLAAHDLVEDIGAVLSRKLEAIACYRSQMAQFRYDRATVGLAQYRGALAGKCDYAEVFALLDSAPVKDH
jgi:LmbE family N-acetylglucosaminyl deacetylase